MTSVMRQSFGLDHLELTVEQAQFYNYKSGKYLLLAYYSFDSENAYYVNNSEIFALENLDIAIEAYVKRLAEPFKVSGMGQSHDEIFVREKLSERPATITTVSTKVAPNGYEYAVGYRVYHGDPDEAHRIICEFVSNMTRGK